MQADFDKEKAELEARHQAAMAESEAMMARRQGDSQQFTYIVRGSKGKLASGSVPRQIFQAEPESALAHIYNGKWEYAADEQGRAIVNSNPLHWPQILDWLSFGTVPEKASRSFISECTYWQLNKLLAAIDLQTQEVQGASAALHVYEASNTQGHSFTVNQASTSEGTAGFTLTGKFNNFRPRFQDEGQGALVVGFRAFGAPWEFQIAKKGAYIRLMSGPDIKVKRIRVVLGPSGSWARDNDSAFSPFLLKAVDTGGRGYGYDWRQKEQERAAQLTLLDIDGSLQVSVMLTFS